MHQIQEVIDRFDRACFLVEARDADEFTEELKDLGFRWGNGKEIEEAVAGLPGITGSTRTLGYVSTICWATTIGLNSLPHLYYSRFKTDGIEAAMLDPEGRRYSLGEDKYLDVTALNKARNAHPDEEINTEQFVHLTEELRNN